MAKNEIAETKDQLPAEFDFDFAADSGVGMEGADKDSFAIPFLNVIQTNSPQVDESESVYIEAAKPGMLFNTVDQRIFDGKEGMLFLPCAYQRVFIRWSARGGVGFKGEMKPEEVAAARENGEIVEYEGKLFYPLDDGTVDPKKCDIVRDTRNHFGIIYNPETGEASQVLLSLSSTQIKKSKQLMSMLNNAKIKTAAGQAVTPPTWMNIMRITTVRESNDEGSWYGVKFTPEGFLQDKQVYAEGKKFHEAIKAGQVGAKFEAAEPAADKADDKF